MGILMFSVSLMLNMCSTMSQDLKSRRSRAADQAATMGKGRAAQGGNGSAALGLERTRGVDHGSADEGEGAGHAESQKQRRRHGRSSSRARGVRRAVQDALDTTIVPQQERMQRQLDAISALVTKMASTEDTMAHEMANIRWAMQQAVDQQDRRVDYGLVPQEPRRLEVSTSSRDLSPTPSEQGLRQYSRYTSSKTGLVERKENTDVVRGLEEHAVKTRAQQKGESDTAEAPTFKQR